ncbi:hypothetical protein CTI12_AA030400 [Artemisia annua]|uniref:Uncharacterized protein n=1 Tax=Artemisia annua TaxID=35608 RepID=A0A2U1QH32_ARTAN|nr:hypothetical protein CTI12_AA030400 [Artemisia annua]
MSLEIVSCLSMLCVALLSLSLLLLQSYDMLMMQQVMFAMAVSCIQNGNWGILPLHLCSICQHAVGPSSVEGVTRELSRIRSKDGAYMKNVGIRFFRNCKERSSNTSKRVLSRAALKAAQQTKDGRDVEVSNLCAELETVKDETLGAMEQLKEAESKAKALPTMTQNATIELKLKMRAMTDQDGFRHDKQIKVAAYRCTIVMCYCQDVYNKKTEDKHMLKCFGASSTQWVKMGIYKCTKHASSQAEVNPVQNATKVPAAAAASTPDPNIDIPITPAATATAAAVVATGLPDACHLIWVEKLVNVLTPSTLIHGNIEPQAVHLLALKEIISCLSIWHIQVELRQWQIPHQQPLVADDLSPSIAFIDEIDAVSTKRYIQWHQCLLTFTIDVMSNYVSYAQLDELDSRGDVR